MEVVCIIAGFPPWLPNAGMPGSEDAGAALPPASGEGLDGASCVAGGAACGAGAEEPEMMGSGNAMMELQTGHSTVVP